MVRIKDWAVRPEPVAPFARTDMSAHRDHVARRRNIRMEVGTYANDLAAAPAFLGRNCKSLEGCLITFLAEKYRAVIDGCDFRCTFPIDLPPDVSVHEYWPALIVSEQHSDHPPLA